MPGDLLIVEDDPAIGSSLDRALTNAGYACTLVTSIEATRSVEVAPDLALLDLGLPDGDGLDLARELLTRWPDLPVIMLTARAEEMDVVIGLDAGAVDYITKPFRLAELLARVRAQLRRPVERPDLGTVADGDLSVDVPSRRVTLAGRTIELRPKEFDLLVELMSNKGIVVTREDLMLRVWDEHWFGSTKTLDVHMAALRRRLGEEPGEPSRITSIRGVGYRWETAGTPS
jgi:DNA-binding response OmpR family regulator